jgi:2-phosphosulfolactate phosphatase
MPQIEVCFSPALYPFRINSIDTIIVVIDVLRATTSFCTAFNYGVEAIIPVASLEDALKHKLENKLVAAERDGLKPDFADFGNSAFDFMDDNLAGKTIYYTTTNGTRAINTASKDGIVAIASFLNLPSISNWLINQNKNIVLLCAGWKDTYCIEDSLCAGAIANEILHSPNFELEGDSALSSIELWDKWSFNPADLIRKSSHYKRLKALGYEIILDYSLHIGHSKCIPVLVDNKIIDLAKPHFNKTV